LDRFFFESTTSATSSSNACPSSSSSSVRIPNEEGTTNETKEPFQQQRRVLGSQELLMLPRQYSPGNRPFPQMNHVSCHVLSATPSVALLKQAVDAAMQTHPLLQARVEGDGEPDKRIDLFQMVRKGDPNPLTFVTDDRLTAEDVVTVVETANVEASWKAAFQRDMDDGSWCHPETGPLWKLELHKSSSNDSDGECALLFSANHAISDQSSANRLMDQILRHLVELESSGSIGASPPKPQTIPVSLEDSVMGMKQRWNDVELKGVSLETIKYVVGKAAEGLKSPVILPDKMAAATDDKDGSGSSSGNPLSALAIIAGRTAGGQDTEQRRSAVAFRSLSAESTAKLVKLCREQGVSVSHALTAAVTLGATDFIGNSSDQKRNYKILQSLDMRRFGKQLDQGDTFACMASSHDLMHGPLPDQSGRALRENPSAPRRQQFWDLAVSGQEQTADFIESGGPYQAVRVFDFAMSISDLNNLVHLTAQSKDTKGRAYSAGVTNVGVYERQLGFATGDDNNNRPPLSTEHGRYKVKSVYYATPHVTSGCLYPVSTMTINGELHFTFNPVTPIVSPETNQQFADAFVELLETVVSDNVVEHVEDNKGGLFPFLPQHALTTATAVVGLAAVLSHAGAWAEFFGSVSEMKANIADPADFWAALNFWIFFAVGHPILQPILAISDVLHGSPGPMAGGLVPASFILGNIIVIAAVTLSKEVRLYYSIWFLSVAVILTPILTFFWLLPTCILRTDSQRSQHCGSCCILYIRRRWTRRTGWPRRLQFGSR